MKSLRPAGPIKDLSIMVLGVRVSSCAERDMEMESSAWRYIPMPRS